MTGDDLIDLLRKYEVPVDQSALESVFQDEEQGRLLSEWAKSHLVADTLLTKNELNSYLAIEQNGKAESLAASSDLSRVQAFSDQEIFDAIEELNRSTDAINKQTETLRQQQNALSRLITTKGKTGDARTDLETRRLHEWGRGRKALQTSVELLSQGVDYRISDLDQGTKELGRELTDVVGEVLQSDDKLLGSLQKLGWELETEDPEETENVGQLREICARLIKYTVECIRTKLDRSYLESLEVFTKPSSENQAPKEELGALQEELESLYSEILPVAQMSVEQQWLKPSLRSLSAQTGQGVGHATEAIQYILHCLEHLQDRIDRLSDRATSFKAHESATGTLVATARAELSEPATSDSIKRRATAASLSSPARRFQPTLADDIMTPAPRRRRANTKSRRRSSGGTSYDSALEHLLGELAISLPGVENEDTGAAASAQAQAAQLSNILAERTQKACDVADSVQSVFEHTATSQLTEARTALQLIRDSVLAESPYSEVHLVDPGIESSIGVLAQEVHNVTSRLEGVESEAAVLAKGRNLNRDEIISRWGHRG
ncbi:hypothetical protein N8I77_007567 [Diaporthe amygdali]|uniref:Uncharacterized protein n=1 Tax=Phomopsis amygdali TaxID=1214568 RepID=A0AAD9SD35_PHOAM|nr:hypothetical protein N8I77_007567 [Diaporthe amygdali]